MIREHEFNSSWWGKPVGIVTDAAFFHLPTNERDEALDAFDWVEFKSPLESEELDLRAVHASGFFQVDTQINYRLNLKAAGTPESLDRFQVEFADETPFSITAEEVKDFEDERFLRLPGATKDRVNQRYAIWSRQHIARTPSTCLRVTYKGRVEGWYLADKAGGPGLNLTLGMLSRDSDISGLLFFQKAYQGFAARGHKLAWAAFSVQNSAVHNIYASIGARFYDPVGCWFRIRS